MLCSGRFILVESVKFKNVLKFIGLFVAIVNFMWQRKAYSFHLVDFIKSVFNGSYTYEGDYELGTLLGPQKYLAYTRCARGQYLFPLLGFASQK